MGRSSPAVKRVAAILNFIASHPGQAFTLTDIVRALKLSRATCHALLMGLVEVGYLYRASDKQYVLGPALVAIGRTAAQHASPLQIAQPEMRALADEFDGLCAAYVRDDHEVELAGYAASVSNLHVPRQRSARMRLHPPAAAIFFVRSPPAEMEAWLDAARPAPTPEQRATMRELVAFIRSYGFNAIVNDPPPAEGEGRQEQFGANERRNFPITHLTELDPSKDYDLSAITAPVFDADGQVAFVISLTGVPQPTSGAEVKRLGERLRDACDRISEYITGRQSKAVQMAF